MIFNLRALDPYWRTRRSRTNTIICGTVMVLSLLSFWFGWAFWALLVALTPFTAWVIANLIIDQRAMRRMRAELTRLRAKYEGQP